MCVLPRHMHCPLVDKLVLLLGLSLKSPLSKTVMWSPGNYCQRKEDLNSDQKRRGGKDVLSLNFGISSQSICPCQHWSAHPCVRPCNHHWGFSITVGRLFSQLLGCRYPAQRGSTSFKKEDATSTWNSPAIISPHDLLQLCCRIR